MYAKQVLRKVGCTKSVFATDVSADALLVGLPLVLARSHTRMPLFSSSDFRVYLSVYNALSPLDWSCRARHHRRYQDSASEDAVPK